jgi:hypothetical protein
VRGGRRLAAALITTNWQKRFGYFCVSMCQWMTINKFAQSDQLYSELTVENMPGGVFRGQILAKLVPFSVVKQFEYTKVYPWSQEKRQHWNLVHLILSLSISYPYFNKNFMTLRTIATIIKWGVQLRPNRPWLYPITLYNYNKIKKGSNLNIKPAWGSKFSIFNLYAEIQ